MGEMRSSRRTEASFKNSAQLFADHNIGTELTTAWKGLAQSKAALRHIENRLEATPGTGFLLDSVFEPPNKKSAKTVHNNDGQVDALEGTSKPISRNPAKSSSRSPLRNTTQDSNVRKNSSVEFREPLASYREATPPSRPFSQLEAYNLQSVPGSSYTSSSRHSDPLPSQMVYQRDTRDKQTDRDLNSTHSSALESAEVRFLNDQSALDVLKTEENAHKTQFSMDESNPCIAPTPGSSCQGESTPSTSPGSASQRLENLKRHQPDDKLEKLKARIRRQRKHLEEAADKEKMQGHFEKPVAIAVQSDSAGVNTMPTAKTRKVTAGPPAPIYKGFNSTETKIQTPDGKVWNEEDFHNLSREIYSDTSRHFPESSRSKHQQQRERRTERSSEKRPSKLVRKVQRVPPISDLNSKPAISPASWREGQKLVKMVLGPGPGPPREEHSSHPASRQTRTDAHHGSKLHSEPNRSSRPTSTERLRSGSKERPTSRSSTTYKPLSAAQEKTPLKVSTDLLSSDIQGILDDLQLDCEVAEKEERARKRSRGGSVSRRGRGGSGSQTRTPVSTWGTTSAANTSSRGCRSASPTTHQADTINTANKGHKRRHYDADTVRQYIARQQEERKRRQAEEKREAKEEAERRNQRLQELYRKQREVAKTVPPSAEALMAPVQKRLQETYTKLLQEDAQLNEETTQRLSAPSSQMRPVYQPSGESDKENKQHEVPQSPSSSDKSLNDLPPPPLSRSNLDVGLSSLLQPDRLCPSVQPTFGPSCSTQAPSNEHLLSQLLRLEAAVAASNIKFSERPATAPYSRSQAKMSRIEAIKATATSLSNRIETEARKLAGQDFNYGAATSLDVDTILAPRTSNLDHCWTDTVSCATKNDDRTPRMYTVPTSAGHSSYSGTALPGVGNLHDLREKKEKSHTGFTNPHTISADVNVPAYNGYAEERSRLFSVLEKKERAEKSGLKTNAHKEDSRTDLHDSSAGSISEGPILSEGSFSEDEGSHRHCSDNHVPLSDLLVAKDYCASQGKNKQRLLEFQREAAMCSPFLPLDSGKPPWEELNKGSPLSVINIFTKNVHGHVKASERNLDGNSPHASSTHSGKSPGSAAVYEDDFVSSQSSKTSDQRGSNSPSRSQHLSSGSTPGSSPHSRHSARKKGTTSDQSDATLVEEQRSSPPSEGLFLNGKKRRSDKSSSPTQAKSVHSNDTSLETSGHTSQRPRLTSLSGSPDSTSPGADSLSEPLRSGSFGVNVPNISTSIYNGGAESRSTGELQYSPAVLQQQMAAELQYLESIEESMKQMGDIERLMCVSVAQQESASLAQILKAKQQHHERELYELKIKAEREAFETKLQLEENRQRVARAHLELQESLAASQKESLEGLQESTSKMMSQQAEAARHTAEAARHLKEMTELAQSQKAGTLIIPPDYASMDQRKEHRNSKLQEDKSNSDSEVSSRRTRSEEPSQSDSLSFRRPDHSVSASSSSHHSPSHISSDHREQPKKEASAAKQGSGIAKERLEREAASSSIEEDLPSAANGSLCSESIPSVVDEKDNTSVATEYSFKFEESMTEDEIEERSFRSLLPSEAHRRGTMEKKSRHNEEAEEDGTIHNAALVSGTGSHNTFKSYNAHIAFSGGQDSFSQFTMEMVRQYMKDEEVRLQHQSSLLHLRQRALKEKTRTELAWLEHQRKKLRDKGEDDKMPPIRKKQRGLLIKLQQEQAEIKRLQEANKAARKERQLLLKQQEEIERMRNSTLRLKERLKCAGGQTPPETPVSELPESEPASPNSRMFKDDRRSPSPSLSISGSETSSIMQKLKKMRSHMDEKFLTKREQQLMQRRHHAEELLQWKQQLDQEEAEVRRMEKEAMAVWKQKRARDKHHEMPESPGKEISETGPHTSHHQSFEATSDSEKGHISEGNCSSVTSESTIHTVGPDVLSAKPDSVSEASLASVQSYTQDFSSESQPPNRKPSLLKASHSPAASPADGSSKTKMQLHSTSWTQSEVITQPLDSLTATQSENISDQSDIEGRIKALKQELRQRKFMAYQLKKEQKKRHKERLKAQEASLLKQLQNYNNFIEKTKAELNKEFDSTPDSKSVLEQSSIKSPLYRSETSKGSDSERTPTSASFEQNALPQAENTRFTSKSLLEDLSDKELSTPRVSVHSRPESETLKQKMGQRSDIEEELKVEISSKSEDERSHHLLKFEKENSLDVQESLPTTKHVSSVQVEEHQRSPSVRPGQDTDMKHSVISKVEEAVMANGSGEHPLAVVDVETSSVNDYTHSPDSAVSSKKKPSINDCETSPIADSYYDDFESTRSSPREENTFEPESQVSSSHTEIKHSSKDSSSREPTFDNQEEVVEEEMSKRSSVSEESHQSERLFDLNQQRGDFQHDNKGTLSSLQTPLSVKDEMPNFGIGDRVLVGGVQPGILRFKGPTSFANGFWAGVELDKSEGSNNGTYDGIIYFKCEECHGIFAPPDKITHLPDKYELYADATEDEDSFYDDLLDKGGNKQKNIQDNSQKQGDLESKNEETFLKETESRDSKVVDEKNQAPFEDKSHLNSQLDKESTLLISKGNTEDIILDLEDTSHAFLISDMDINGLVNKEMTAIIERNDVDFKKPSSPADLATDTKNDKSKPKDREFLDTFADTLIKNFVKDAVEQFAEIKTAKEEKIKTANQLDGGLFGENEEEKWIQQKDGLPFFLPSEKEELSSPELCNRPESPMLGAIGQEELVKRLAELELSRELVDEFGDDQDWFDEDFGLSSRRKQQRIKQKEEEAKLGGELGRSASSSGPLMGEISSSLGGESQVKTPPRPELPLPLPPKLPEQPAMVVPHSAKEVEKMVYAATLEIWETCELRREGALALEQLPNPTPSLEYLGRESSSQDQEAISIRSYRKAVYDLTWEILQEIYTQDPNTDQPQWVKQRQVKSSSIHKVQTSGDISKIQEFVTAEILKLYNLAEDQNQKSDWQKMLKFGRKKRDRVDHILVQELHEEEAQWVNYDEDELFVKLQLADSIFDALLKDTADAFTLISEKRAKRGLLS